MLHISLMEHHLVLFIKLHFKHWQPFSLYHPHPISNHVFLVLLPVLKSTFVIMVKWIYGPAGVCLLALQILKRDANVIALLLKNFIFLSMLLSVEANFISRREILNFPRRGRTLYLEKIFRIRSLVSNQNFLKLLLYI